MGNGIEHMAAPRTRRRVSTAERAWVSIGTLTILVIELVALGVPSFWYDEAATYSAASRTWSGLWALLGNIDAVHGLFYSLQHPLVHLVGPNTFAMRAPSALAVALTAAGVYALTRRYGSPLSATAGAVIFVGLARTSSVAVEARSFALAALVATVLSLILISALRGTRRAKTGWLLLYIVLAVAGIYLYVYLALVVVAHACTVLWSRPGRRTAAAALAALAVIGVLCLPLVAAVLSQRGQLGGTFPVTVETWTYVFFSQFFDQQWAQALAVWGLLGASAGVLLLRGSRKRAGTSDTATSHRAHDDDEGRHPSLLAFTVPWLLLPTAVIVAISTMSPTIYQPRALVISAPALCILVAEAARRAFGARVAIVAALVVVALGVGPFVAARQLTSQGEDWPVVAEHLATRAARGDGIVYSQPVDYHSWPSLIRITYPWAVDELDDVTLAQPYTEIPELFDRRIPLASTVATDRLDDLGRVWYVRSQLATAQSIHKDAAVLSAAGFTRTSTWSGPRTSVEEWVRSGR